MVEAARWLPNTFTPTMRSPTIGSFDPPNDCDRPMYAAPVSTGLLCCSPYRLPPVERRSTGSPSTT
jgi:hypothetical protein